MTPQEKAKQLISKFCVEGYMQARAGMSADWRTRQAKKYALACVEEMIEFENRIIEQLENISTDAKSKFKVESKFWDQVKESIINQ
jgi:hypothetical protein